ncbi:MAG: hypothetical protein HC788_04895 [Sphingopyxis sp.]|nr:hypothetical protein [Sphingopyxis sp.]
MAHLPLNAREWLESLRLVSDCQFIPELLDLLEDAEGLNLCREALDDIADRMPAVVRALFREGETARFAERVCDALDLLEAVEEVGAEYLSDLKTHPNGAPFDDIADKLRYAFDSERWLTYNL